MLDFSRRDPHLVTPGKRMVDRLLLGISAIIAIVVLCGCNPVVEIEGSSCRGEWRLYYWGYGPYTNSLKKATHLILARIDASESSSTGSILSPTGGYYVTVNDLAYPVGAEGNLILIDARSGARVSVPDVRHEDLTMFYRRADVSRPRIPSALKDLTIKTGEEKAQAMAEAMISDMPKGAQWFKKRGIELIQPRSRREIEQEWLKIRNAHR